MRLVKRNFHQPKRLFPMLFDHLYADDTRIKHTLERQRKFWDDFQQRMSNSSVPANIKNEETRFVIELAAPGFEKSDFKIELDEGVLTVHASKEAGEGTEDTKEGYTHREFAFKAFKRTFNLPEDRIELDSIKAEYQSGILSVVLPKREVEDTKRNFDVQ